MAECELRLLFNKEDRRYYTGEPVSGKVVVKARKDCSIHDFWIDYGWRTHGRGNKDEGGKGFIRLMGEGLAFRSGEIREFPFRLPALCEPLTYHGHYVNVDWYLKASLMTQGFLPMATHAEEDFLLLDRNMSNAPLPTPPSEKPKRKFSLLFLVSLQGLLVILMALLVLSPLLFILPSSMSDILVLGIVFAGFFAWVFHGKIINFLLQRIIGIKEVRVYPITIRPGGQATCFLQFQVNFPVTLEQITAEIRARECAESGSGTQTRREEYILYSEQTDKSYGEELAAGRMITFDCSMLIPTNAPPTFIAADNLIDWSIHLYIVCKHLPIWEKNFQIVVVSPSA